MEFFLVFLLGMGLAVMIVFIARPGFFARSSNPDFSLYEMMFEESMAELEQRHKEMLLEIEERQVELLDMHQQIVNTFTPGHFQSPKVLAVLELADKGHDMEHIAKKLGLGTGEVQLIIELNKDREILAETD